MARRRLFSRNSGYDGGRGFGSAEMRNPERELFLFRRRLAVVAALALFAFGGLFARFVYLQVFAARALRHAGGVEPHRDRAHRSRTGA